MKIKELNAVKSFEIANRFEDAIYDMNDESLSETINIMMDKLSTDTKLEIVFCQGYSYEIGIVDSEDESYEWLIDFIEGASTEEDALSIANDIIEDGNYAGYDIVVLKVPNIQLLADKIPASAFEVARYTIPEEEYDE